MPAILDGEEEVRKWLDFGEVKSLDAMELLQSKDILTFHPVSSLVNNSRNNSPKCLQPIDVNSRKVSESSCFFINTVAKLTGYAKCLISVCGGLYRNLNPQQAARWWWAGWRAAHPRREKSLTSVRRKKAARLSANRQGHFSSGFRKPTRSPKPACECSENVPSVAIVTCFRFFFSETNLTWECWY